MILNQSTALPTYDRPPVIEVVYGVQFDPLAEWRTPLIGVLWQTIKQAYPKFKEMPVLAPVIERFDHLAQTEQPSIEFLDRPPLPRLFFLDSNENWVLQVQHDRFLHNWKRMQDSDHYPRFNAVSERFFAAWTEFLNFLDSQNIPSPNITQLEVTYINHIPVERGKTVIDEIETDFMDLSWAQDHEFLPRPELVTWTSTFRLPENQGRLHISLRPGQRRKDKTSVLLLELTARGIPKSCTMPEIKSWFALGREWVVRGFADITKKNAQKQRWGLNE